MHPEWPTLGITTSHKDLHKLTVYRFLHYQWWSYRANCTPPPPAPPFRDLTRGFCRPDLPSRTRGYSDGCKITVHSVLMCVYNHKITICLLCYTLHWIVVKRPFCVDLSPYPRRPSPALIHHQLCQDCITAADQRTLSLNTLVSSLNEKVIKCSS